jgi:hypothetical protein
VRLRQGGVNQAGDHAVDLGVMTQHDHALCRVRTHSPGLRAMAAYHRENPYELEVEVVRAGINYEPAESFPLNYMVISALERYNRFFGDDLHGRVPDRIR